MASKAKKRALLLLNPRARNGDGPMDAVRAILTKGGIELIDAAPTKNDNASDIISRQADQVDMVIVGGGDGTLNAAASGLVHTGLPLGILPLGTANDFARTIGLPTEPEAAAKIITKGKEQVVDLGEVNGHLFNVASIGFSAELAAELSEKAKKRFGKLGYGIVAARLLARSRLFTAHLEHDGAVEDIHTLQVSVGNGRHYGGGMTVEENATADDGWLDFYSLEVDHWWKLLQLLPQPARRHPGSVGRCARLPHEGGDNPHVQPASGQHRWRIVDLYAGALPHPAKGAAGLCAGHLSASQRHALALQQKYGLLAKKVPCPPGHG